MAIGRNIESLLKAVRSLEIGVSHNRLEGAEEVTEEFLYEKLLKHRMIVSSIFPKQFAVVFPLKKLRH